MKLISFFKNLFNKKDCKITDTDTYSEVCDYVITGEPKTKVKVDEPKVDEINKKLNDLATSKSIKSKISKTPTEEITDKVVERKTRRRKKPKKE